jgi:hypothetical protein
MIRSRLSKLVLLTLAGLAWKRAADRRRTRAAWSERARDAAPEAAENPVRSGGPGAMRDPPRGWDPTDEAGDQSFPASDPPGRY